MKLTLPNNTPTLRQRWTTMMERRAMPVVVMEADSSLFVGEALLLMLLLSLAVE